MSAMFLFKSGRVQELETLTCLSRLPLLVETSEIDVALVSHNEGEGTSVVAGAVLHLDVLVWQVHHLPLPLRNILARDAKHCPVSCVEQLCVCECVRVRVCEGVGGEGK